MRVFGMPGEGRMTRRMNPGRLRENSPQEGREKTGEGGGGVSLGRKDAFRTEQSPAETRRALSRERQVEVAAGAHGHLRLKTLRTVSTACMVYSGLAASWKRSFMKDMGS